MSLKTLPRVNRIFWICLHSCYLLIILRLWILKYKSFSPLKATDNILISIFFIIGLLAVSFTSSFAQNAIQVQSFNQESGLSNDFVTQILQDRHGFIWIGTENGLSRFDGYQFSNFEHDPDDPQSLWGNYILSLFEDSKGRLWVGTKSGLARLDRKIGKFIRVSLRNPARNNTSEFQITSMYEDKDHNIWMGTHNDGLLKLLEETAANSYQVFQVKLDANSNEASPNSRLEQIVEDLQGDIWLGYYNGVARYSKSEKQLHFFPCPEESNLNTPIQRYLPGVNLEEVGMILLNENLNNVIYLRQFLSPALLERFHSYFTAKTGQESFWPEILRAAIDQKNRIWLGTSFGLFQIDLGTEEFAQYNLGAAQPGQTRSNRIHRLYVDRQDRLWLSSYGNGIFIKDPVDPPIQFHFHNPFDPSTISEDQVRAIEEDNEGDLWVGTLNSGLERLSFSREKGWRKVQQFTADQNAVGQLVSDRILDITKDQNGTLWMGTGNGLNSYDPVKNVWKRYAHNPTDPNTLSGNYIWTILADRDGIIWVGDFLEGLNRLDPRTGKVRRYQNEPDNPKSLINSRVKSIAEDKDGLLWIGTNKGLASFNKETGTFTRYQNDTKNPNSLSHELVWSVLVDQNNTVWAGTSVGLNRLDRETNQFEHYFTKQGLPSNVINGLLEDTQGRIWVSTDRGLAVFTPPTIDAEKDVLLDVQIFQSGDGLGGNLFLSKALAKSRDGNRLYFGGPHGFNTIDPSLIQPDTQLTNFQLSVFSKYNQKVPNGKPILDPFIASKEKIVLTHLDRVLNFEFSDLTFRKETPFLYEYQLAGFSDQWIPLGNRRTITLTDLKPGHYTLSLRLNNIGQEAISDTEMVKITVLPPWWRSSWAYATYVILFAGLAFLLYRFQLKRQLEIQENQKLKELDTFKNRFYSYITHEFRTPLTVIGGMAQQIKKAPDKYLGKGLQMIERNSDNMLDLVNQILDLRKLESGNLKLNLIQGNIIAYLRYIIESFDSFAVSNEVQLHFLNQETSILMDYDKEKILRILSNLISNAIKFTPKGGDVYITANQDLRIIDPSVSNREEACLVLSVKDTGIGIPKNEIPMIFDRFYQIGKEDNLERTKKRQGTGLGLSLTRELIKLKGGSIDLESEVGKGTTFHILLPISREAALVEDHSIDPAKKKQIIPQSIKINKDPLDKPADLVPLKNLENAEELEPSLDSGNPSLLIIEDNPEVVQYLESLLESEYTLSIARDGQEGIEKALEVVPDLIISDVMMPKKDGFEVCETLKNDDRTSHIPIVILTAKASDESRIMGLQRGADAYLAKPFNQEELFVRLKKLRELRTRLQDRYRTLAPPKKAAGKTRSRTKLAPGGKVDGDLTPHSDDHFEDAFIIKLRKIVEKRMKKPEFGIPELCKATGMSRSQLHLKLKALTNRSTSHFIRGIRLQRAKALLEEGTYSVGDVAKKVGFSDPTYFSKTFHDEFGLSPRAFLKKIQE